VETQSFSEHFSSGPPCPDRPRRIHLIPQGGGWGVSDRFMPASVRQFRVFHSLYSKAVTARWNVRSVACMKRVISFPIPRSFARKRSTVEAIERRMGPAKLQQKKRL
jgi:hypothetical protein